MRSQAPTKSRFREALLSAVALVGALGIGGSGLAASVVTGVSEAPPETTYDEALIVPVAPPMPKIDVDHPLLEGAALQAPAPAAALVVELPQPVEPPQLPAHCPKLPPVEQRWMPPQDDGTLATITPADAPPSLERRVRFWMNVWGTRPDDVYGLSDERRPWIVHGEVDCRDIMTTDKSNEEKDRLCGGRLGQARKELSLRLQRTANSPRMLRLYDNNRSLAKTAWKSLIGIEGRKNALNRAQERAARELPHAENLFAKAGVPRIFARTAFVESLWRPTAQSKAGAAGAFQFMPSTGRAYLKVDDSIDERLDALRSSWAAARYLKDVSRDLKSWPLVLTAYNQGPARMKGLIKKRGTRDLGQLVDGGNDGNFGFDGQNYYAQIVAVTRLTDDLRVAAIPLQTTAVEVSEPMFFAKLASCLRLTPLELARANPALTARVVTGESPVPAGYVAMVPNEPVRTAAAR